MELDNQYGLRPKTKNAAIRQAAQLQLIKDSRKEKKVNIMKREQEIKQKIERLNSELDRLEDAIKNLDADSETYQERISLLQTQFEITENDILEARLQIIQRSLKKTEALKAAGLKERPSDFI